MNTDDRRDELWENHTEAELWCENVRPVPRLQIQEVHLEFFSTQGVIDHSIIIYFLEYI